MSNQDLLAALALSFSFCVTACTDDAAPQPDLLALPGQNMLLSRARKS